MMQCRELTNDVLTGPIPQAARTHLEQCAACRARREELRSLEHRLTALGRALPSESNPSLVRRIAARIPIQPASTRAAWRWAIGLAAAALLFGAILLATRQTPTPEVQREMVAVPAQPPIETVLDPVPPPPAPKPVTPAPTPVETPRAPETPAPKPAPAPVPVPETPAPKPVEAPAPPAPPKETKPARIVLALAGVEGALDLQDGEAWKRVTKSADWDAAASLRSGDRIARFTLPDGTRATLRPRTELRIAAAEPPSLSLERGEAFFEVIPGAGRKFSVLTADARVQVTGTQFSVKRSDHTEVYVSSGEVRVGNDKGEVSVAAGNATSARKGAVPAKPKALDADRANAWRRELDPAETARFRFDFEDGRLPLPWSTGRVVNFGPARGLNRYCLQGQPNVEMDWIHIDKRIGTMRDGLKLRFRYWTAGADLIYLQIFDERTKSNHRFEIPNVAKGKWESVEIPLSELARLIDGEKLKDGDRLTWFSLVVANPAGDTYFDDIELVEVQK